MYDALLNRADDTFDFRRDGAHLSRTESRLAVVEQRCTISLRDDGLWRVKFPENEDCASSMLWSDPDSELRSADTTLNSSFDGLACSRCERGGRFLCFTRRGF
jgi:hypothetical protein